MNYITAFFIVAAIAIAVGTRLANRASWKRTCDELDKMGLEPVIIGSGAIRAYYVKAKEKK